MNKRNRKLKQKQEESEEEEEYNDSEDYEDKGRRAKGKKAIGKKRNQNLKNKFFDIEADEGADSDDGRATNKKGAAAAIKDAFYDPSELKRKNVRYDEAIADMEKRARREEDRRAAVQDHGDAPRVAEHSEDDGLKSEYDS